MGKSSNKKLTFLNDLSVTKPLVVSKFTKKRRAESLQPGVDFDVFNPQFESSIFKCISWLYGLFYVG
jgi:hypothetical protein